MRAALDLTISLVTVSNHRSPGNKNDRFSLLMAVTAPPLVVKIWASGNWHVIAPFGGGVTFPANF